MATARTFLRRHAIALTALFIVLGGTAVALPGKNSVDSGDIAKRSVKSSDLAKQAVKGKNLAKSAVKKAKIKNAAVAGSKLADGAVSTPKLGDNAVTGAKADEASFEGVLKGDGRLLSGALTVPATNADFVDQFPFPVLVSVPGFGRVELITCKGDSAAAPNQMRVRVIAHDDATEYLFIGQGIGQDRPGGAPFEPTTTDSTGGLQSSGGGGFITAQGNNPTVGTIGHFEIQMSRGSGTDATGATVQVDVLNDSTDSEPLGECHATAQAMIQE